MNRLSLLWEKQNAHAAYPGMGAPQGSNNAAGYYRVPMRLTVVTTPSMPSKTR